MSKIKCIPCDGLGYHYNQVTFQSENCPQCEGKGEFEVQTAPVIDETKVETSKPVVEKLKKAPIVETPIVEEPTTFYGTGSIETTTSGSL
jgi:RecJ-like exonuclease